MEVAGSPILPTFSLPPDAIARQAMLADSRHGKDETTEPAGKKSSDLDSSPHQSSDATLRPGFDQTLR